jgi:hypothetical protein
MTKTDVLDAFVAASSKAGETLTITSDIPNVAVASFAVDVLRRKGHRVKTRFKSTANGDTITYEIHSSPIVMDRIVKATTDIEQLFGTYDGQEDIEEVHLHACGTAIARCYDIVVYSQSRGWAFDRSTLGSVPMTVATADGIPKILWKTTSTVVIKKIQQDNAQS